jgi:arylsulfatase A-like enzyme
MEDVHPGPANHLRRAVLVVVTLLVTAVSCTRSYGPGEPSDAGVAFDPVIVDRSPESLRQRFDGSAGKIVLGTGWYGLEQAFSWAAQDASVYFGTPTSADVELVGRLTPFSYPGAPAQTLTVVLNGKALPAVAVPADGRELRVPLPGSALRSPLNALEMKFAYATSPSAVIASADSRRLAALVSDLAIVRRGQPLAAEDSEIRGAGAVREATLRGGGLAIPLPAGQRYRVRFATAAPSRPGATLDVDLGQGGSFRPLWHGSVEARVEAPLLFSAAPGAPAVLRVRADPRDGAVSVRISAPEVLERDPTSPVPGRPNVFLYVVDTLRADALGTYGYSRPTSPRIDAFARDAVTYERASSTASWTLPATVSMLSGVYAFTHGMTEMGTALPAEGIPWLPETLARLGYETAAISQWPLGQPFGLDRGFSTYTLDVRLMTKSYSELARGLLWQYLLHRPTPQKPLFAYVHVSDVHAVYGPKGEDLLFAEQFPGALAPVLYNPQSFMARRLGLDRAETAHLRALYDGEVRYADRQFGAFLDLLRYAGLYDDSLIILVSDHGEEFFEHGGFDHGRTLYEELLHVPLIVKFPHQRQGARVTTRVSIVDLPPTVLASLGRSGDEPRFQGRPLPRNDEAGPPREIFSETRVSASNVQGVVDLDALASGDVKCIRNALPVDRFGKRAAAVETYDLAADPSETRPLAATDGRVSACIAELDRWVARARKATPRDGKGVRLTPEEIERLRSLGYLR